MIDVAALAQETKDRVRETVARYAPGSIRLAVLQVGDDPASSIYVRGKLKDCEEVGIAGELYHFPESAGADELLARIAALNADPLCRGMIVQLPLPAHYSREDEARILEAIAPEKDVDGFGRASPHTPCTPRGILAILDRVAAERGWDGLAGKTACVIGRSRIVGEPTALLLIRRGCTVVSCNSHTRELDRWLSQADIIVSAVGKADFLHPGRAVDFTGKVIVDVGMNRDAEGKVCGDCSRALYGETAWITPVPRGVGLMTRACLLANTIEGMK